ncbi:hypothetical protein [Halomonas denitrificans]|nr:hypothetical protein [Halomonas denitrificans]
MKACIFAAMILLSGMPIAAYSGGDTDLALGIVANGEVDGVTIRPGEEIRVSFLSTNEGPADADLLVIGATGLIRNFSFPFDIDCPGLTVAQGRGVDLSDYGIVWQISPLLVNQTLDCQFTLRALSIVDDNETLEIRYLSSFTDPDPSDDEASFEITFLPALPEAVPVPALSLLAQMFLVLGFLILVAAGSAKRRAA